MKTKTIITTPVYKPNLMRVAREIVPMNQPYKAAEALLTFVAKNGTKREDKPR